MAETKAAATPAKGDGSVPTKKADFEPRKCSATNRVIIPKDHASVQINVGHVNKEGVYSRIFETVAFSGFVRTNALADGAMNRLISERGLMRDLTQMPGPEKYRMVKTETEAQ